MNELKPCPFCGSEAGLTNYDGLIKNGHRMKAVACSNKECFASLWHEGDDEDVIERWNRRSTNA